MKAVVVRQPGGPEVLINTTLPTPTVKPGWSLVKIMGFGINHSEIFTREGQSPSVQFPRILGIECVGVIAATTAPERLPLGQKVISIMGEMGRAFDGSYAEYALLPNTQLYPVTTDLPWATLATLPETFYTAFGSLKNLKISATDRVLVRGATSGVGVAFAQLLRGAFPQIKLAGTSRKLNKAAQLMAVGFDDVIEDRQGALQTTATFDKIFELIGPATVKDSFKHLREGGIVCSTGQLGKQWYLEQFDPIIDIQRNSYLTSFYSGNVDQTKLDELLTFVQTRQIPVKPERIFSLAELPDAHRYLQSQASFGKVIVLNTPDRS
ncbi:zinc-binding dehydrogenase [Lapidilactobacillus salsurivasis]